MTNTEERAKQIADNVIKPDSLLSALFHNTIRDCCIEMAEEQRKIDVDKVRKCLNGILSENMISAVCKLIEED